MLVSPWVRIWFGFWFWFALKFGFWSGRDFDSLFDFLGDAHIRLPYDIVFFLEIRSSWYVYLQLFLIQGFVTA